MTDNIDSNVVQFPAPVGQYTPAFQVIDSPRHFANTVADRVVMDLFGHVEPYDESIDTWRSMPLRLAYDVAGGWHIELGPYDLDAADIERLRAAIAAYDKALGR